MVDRNRTTEEYEAGSKSPLALSLPLVLAAVVIAVLDQALKAWVTVTLASGVAIELFGGLVRIDYTENSGAAFGLFRSGGYLFAAVAVLVSAGILWYHRRTTGAPLLTRLALGLILGGATGNLLDRIRHGYVVDFIDLRWWWVFNLADSAIVVGVGLLVAQSLLPSGADTRHG